MTYPSISRDINGTKYILSMPSRNNNNFGAKIDFYLPSKSLQNVNGTTL